MIRSHPSAASQTGDLAARPAVGARRPGARDRGMDRSGWSHGGPAVPAAHRIGNGDVALQVTRIDISATEVRRRVAAGLPIRYLVPQAVEEFIFERKLYLRNGTPVAG